MSDAELWILRSLWLILPFTAGRIFAASLDDADQPFRTGVTVGLWIGWALMLVVLMVPRTETLTVVRIVVPTVPVLLLWAAVDGDTQIGTAEGVVAALTVGAVMAIALRASVADRFVDGSSYGDETRFLLRTPGPLAVGPLVVVWGLVVAGALAGPLLLLAERWLLGAVFVVVGVPVVWFGAQAIHRLSKRWLVFVPAGLVVHDKTALREPQLFSKRDVALFGAAPADADQEDLTLDALGLSLRVRLTGPSKIARNSRSEAAELTDIDGFLVTPNRPGAVLTEAADRGFVIG